MTYFSLLRDPVTFPPRELHIALAHSYAVTKLGDAKRLVLLNRLFQSMIWSDQQRCRAELVRCRQAQRGQSLAVVI